MRAATEITDRAADLVTSRPEEQNRLNTEVNALLRAHNYDGQNQISQDITRRMEQQGVLPQLLLQETTRLNADGQGGITRQDLETVIDNRNNRFDPLTVMAARYARQNFDALDAQSNLFWNNRSGDLTETEMRWHADARRTASPPRRHDAPQTPGELRPHDQPPNPADVRQQNIDILNGRDGNAQSKFRAIEELARLGHNSITLTDAEGRQVQCRIQVSPIRPGSNRNYIHLYGRDSNGRESILLRATGRDGQYSQQVGSDGRQVPYTGSEWNRRFPQSNLGIRN